MWQGPVVRHYSLAVTIKMLEVVTSLQAFFTPFKLQWNLATRPWKLINSLVVRSWILVVGLPGTGLVISFCLYLLSCRIYWSPTSECSSAETTFFLQWILSESTSGGCGGMGLVIAYNLVGWVFSQIRIFFQFHPTVLNFICSSRNYILGCNTLCMHGMIIMCRELDRDTSCVQTSVFLLSFFLRSVAASLSFSFFKYREQSGRRQETVSSPTKSDNSQIRTLPV